MEMNQAVANIQQAANPNHGEEPSDALLRKLRQFQMQNLESQGQGIEQTKAQLAAIGKNAAEQTGMRDPIMWATLADMMSPNKDSNLTPLAMQLKKKNTSGQERYKLQQQLSKQQQNLSTSAGDLLEQMTPEDLSKLEREYELKGILGDTKHEQTLEQIDAKKGDNQYRFDLENLRHQNVLDQIKAKKNDPDYQYKFDLEDLKHKNKLLQIEAQAAAKAKEAASGLNLTTGQEAVDKKFAKDYSDWVSGGFSNVEGNLEKLSGAIKMLEDPNTELGGKILPEAIRVRSHPESVAIEQDVGNVVFQSLKEILGGQFTEKEGQKLVQQTYDPRLDDVENHKKVKSAFEKLSRMAAAKQEAVQYFTDNGTLKGFKGGKYSSLDQYMKDIKKRELDGDGDGDGDDGDTFNQLMRELEE